MATATVQMMPPVEPEVESVTLVLSLAEASLIWAACRHLVGREAASVYWALERKLGSTGLNVEYVLLP